MCAMLIDQHQSGLHGRKDEAPFELQMLRTFFNHGRLTGIKSFGSRCSNALFFDHRKLFRFRIGVGERLIHLTGFLKTAIQIFPVHFRTGVVASTGRRGGLERVEIGIEMYLRRRGRQILFKSRNIGHVLRVEIDRRDSIELAQ